MLTSLCANVYVHISRDIVACFSAHCNGISKLITIHRDHSSTPLARINILMIWARVSLSLALIVSVFTVSFSGGQRCELLHGVSFGPVIAFGNKVQIPVARHCGREMLAPTAYVTDPSHPLGSICYIKSFPYKCQSVPVPTFKWYVKVCLSRNYLTIAHVLFKTMNLRLRTIIQVISTPIRFVPACIGAKDMAISHAYWKGNRPLSRVYLNFCFLGPSIFTCWTAVGTICMT